VANGLPALRPESKTADPRIGEIVRTGWRSRLDTCQDYFFTVSQQDIDRIEASIREQTNPLHHDRPRPR
jgi:hypothetical protein